MAVAAIADRHKQLGDFVQTWSGEASQWECDDLGHLNMRYYLYKVAQARQMLGLMLGLTDSFKKNAYSTFKVREFHIRYLGEARPGAPLLIKSAITDLRETDMDLIHVMYHSDGKPACSVSERIDHISTRTKAAFQWPRRLREAAEPFMVNVPDIARSKGIDLDETASHWSQAEAEASGMSLIGRGVFRPDEANIFGQIPAQALLGRITQTIGHFAAAWPEMATPEFLSGDSHIHGALLEARVIIGASAEPGDGYVFYSGIVSATPNVRTLAHKLYNQVTGDLLASMQGVGCLMDLQKRKHVKTPQDTIEDLTAIAITGLRI